MSDRKYRQRGYQDEPRERDRPSGPPRPKDPRERPEGPKTPNLMASHEVFRCSRCGNRLGLPVAEYDKLMKDATLNKLYTVLPKNLKVGDEVRIYYLLDAKKKPVVHAIARADKYGRPIADKSSARANCWRDVNGRAALVVSISLAGDKPTCAYAALTSALHAASYSF